MVLNKAKLGIQADIFVDVTCGVVRFRAKDRAHLEDTLKDTDHCLLVKLRALRQERWPSKVVQLENVRAALSSCRHDLWRLYLGKSALNQRTAHTSRTPSSSRPNPATLPAPPSTIPHPTRTTRNSTPPKRRSECSHPATRTRSPTCSPTSTVRIRSIKSFLHPYLNMRQYTPRERSQP